MRNAIVYLVILLVVGIVGYFAFPKSVKIPSSVKNTAVKDVSPSGSDTRPAEKETSTAETTEIAEGLTLTISAPDDKVTVNSQALQVIGKTSPNADVFVNDVQAKADSTGNFFVNYSLDEGENVLTVVANDDKGNYAEKELTVYLESTQ